MELKVETCHPGYFPHEKLDGEYEIYLFSNILAICDVIRTPGAPQRPKKGQMLITHQENGIKSRKLALRLLSA